MPGSNQQYVACIDCNLWNTSGLTLEQRRTIYHYLLTQRLVLCLVAPLLLAFGTFGNICVIYVLMQKTFRTTPVTIFFRYLAVVDLTILWTGLLRQIVIGLSGGYFDVRLIGERSCTLHFLLTYTLVSSNNWTLVCITIVRLFLIRFPFHARRYCNRKTAHAIVFIVLFLNCLCYLGLFIHQRKNIVHHDSHGRLYYCDFFDANSGFGGMLFHNLVYFIVPALIIISINTLIYNIHMSHVRRRVTLLTKPVRVDSKQSYMRSSPGGSNVESPILDPFVGCTRGSVSSSVDSAPSSHRAHGQYKLTNNYRELLDLTLLVKHLMEIQSEDYHYKSPQPSIDMSLTRQKGHFPHFNSRKTSPLDSPYGLDKGHGRTGTKLNNALIVAGAKKEGEQVSSLLFAACFVFVLTNFPWSVCMFTQALVVKDVDKVGVARWDMIMNFGYLLLYSNHALNFLLYVVFGSRFRAEFQKGLAGQLTKKTVSVVSSWHKKSGIESPA